MSALRNVLVVDDDPVVAKSFDRVLNGKGYHVITAHDAAEALAQLRGAEVDLVVTDIRMPGMDGLALAEAVRARTPWTPVMIITGYGTAADEARARAAGVQRFLHKPLAPEAIEGQTAAAIAAGVPASTVAAALDAIAAPITPIATPEPTAVTAPETQPAFGWRALRKVRDIALFAAAPVIGLAYAVMLPVVGLATLAWLAGKAAVEAGLHRRAAEAAGFVAKMLAAPLVGLAFVIGLPFIGLAALAAAGVRRALRRPALRHTVQMLAAPWIGLAFVLLLPLAGPALLAWVAIRGEAPAAH